MIIYKVSYYHIWDNDGELTTVGYFSNKQKADFCALPEWLDKIQHKKVIEEIELDKKIL